MKRWIAPIAALALLLPTCTTEARETSSSGDAAAVAKDVANTLEGITSPETAADAKDELAGLVAKLKDAMPSMEGLKGGAEGAMEGLANTAKSLTGELGTAVNSIREQITRLMGNEQALAPIKDVINQLKSVIGMQ
jgi:phage-related minor tail protein